MKEAIKLFVCVSLYALLLRVLMEALGELYSRETSATIIAIIFPIGFLWLLGCLFFGVKEGFWLLKNWIAIFGGLLILSLGLIIPHPLFIIVMAVLAYAFYSKIMNGKSDWLI